MPAMPLMATERASWIDRVRGVKTRLLASASFRRWAAAFPPTRPIARRRARHLFDLCAGFVYSQILFACVQLRIFDLLAQGPQTAAALASQCAMPIDRMSRLLDAAVALRLLARRGADRYALGTLGAPMVGNAAVAAMVEHHVLLYADLGDPVALLRGTREDTALGAYWSYARSAHPAASSATSVAAYSALMAASQSLVAEEILDAYSLRGHRHLLDVGGGDGTFIVAAARRHPDLRLTLFDLPAVAERGLARFTAEGLGHRARAIGGNFAEDALPEGADVISLVRVIHDHGDDIALALLAASRRALAPGGTLLVAEPMARTPGAERVGDAYFGFYLLAMGSGRPRTPEELSQMLLASGFRRIRRVRTNMPLQTRLITAQA
jgi:demethylspheroidene O-methyltransferase